MPANTSADAVATKSGENQRVVGRTEQAAHHVPRVSSSSDNRYARARPVPSETTRPLATMPERTSLVRDNPRPSEAATSPVLAEPSLKRSSTTACSFSRVILPVFAAGFCRRFSSGKTKTVRSGSNDSAMTGCGKPHALHPSTIFGRPLPARSPISTRENIFAIVALRGSETPPARALSISTRNPPGFASSMCSGVFKTTNPRRPQ